MPTADHEPVEKGSDENGIARPAADAPTNRTGAAARELLSALGSDLVSFSRRMARRIRHWGARAVAAAAALPRRPWGFHFKSAFITVLAALVGAITTAASVLVFDLSQLPIERRPNAFDGPSLLLTAADGQALGRVGFFSDDLARREDFPDHVVAAVLSIEDRRFFRHWGVDPWGIARALHANWSAGDIVEGGSTITQQLAKMHFAGRERTYARKLREASIALWLDLHLGKDEILTRYLNSVYFGAGAYGISAAARVYFDKPLKELTIPEAALLAGLIKAPSQYNPLRNPEAARERAALVVDAMVESGALDAKRAEQAKAAPARLNPSLQTARATTWLADWIAKQEFPRVAGSETQNVRVRTTLRPDLQAIAERAINDMLSGPGAKRDVGQAALVAMRPDGAVLAMVGGRNYEDSQFNRAVDAKRQPGSTFKMFVYLAALRAGYSPDDVIDASSLKIKNWQPENFGGRSYGRMPLSQAFAQSINTAAVRLAMSVGLDKVIAAVRDLGIDAPLAKVPSMALGTNELSLLELTGGFASVRAGRTRLKPWGIMAFGPDENAMRPVGAPGSGQPLAQQDELIELLEGVVTSGTGKAANPGGFAAGKTGTSQDFRDAWFIGFTENLVVGVWVGNDDHAPMKQVTGGSLPAQIFQRFVREATPLVERVDPPPLPQAKSRETTGSQGGQCNVAACAGAYRSFRASDCTYRSLGGERRLCEKGSDAPEATRAQTISDRGRATCNADLCARQYSSFDPADCTYQPYGGGPRRLCER